MGGRLNGRVVYFGKLNGFSDVVIMIWVDATKVLMLCPNFFMDAWKKSSTAVACSICGVCEIVSSLEFLNGTQPHLNILGLSV